MKKCPNFSNFWFHISSDVVGSATQIFTEMLQPAQYTTGVLSHHVTHLFFLLKHYQFPGLISPQKIFGRTSYVEQ